MAKTKNSKICFCRSVRPLLWCTKFFGIFPVTTTHRNTECVFEMSKWWVCWSVIILCILIYHTTMYNEVFDLFKKERIRISLHVGLINIVSAIYCIYVIILMVLYVLKTPKIVIALNKISAIMKEGLLCKSALQVILNLQRAFMVIGLVTLSIQLSAFTYLHYSEHYETIFDYKIFVNQFLQHVTSVFYIMFLSYCAIFMGILACLEKMIMYLFDFQPVHYSGSISETNNETVFMGISYKLCNSDHSNKNLLRKYRSHEIIDYIRSLHEEISVLMYDFNECMNLQLLCHMIVELAVLIINYYAVVIYFVYDFQTPISSTIHFLNCLFVIIHTLGILIFLRNSQQLQNGVKGLIPILLEYSTRTSTGEEHQQIRLFIEKLKQHRPINAAGVVNINLSIAGPICANILTYVLVALQFNVPKDQ